MNTDETSGQVSDETLDERRARWERFSMTVLGGAGGGLVDVRNDSHGDDADAHIHSVEVENGAATGCSCPHATHRGAHCKHQCAVEARPLVVSAATAAAATTPTVATDGGREPDTRCNECSAVWNEGEDGHTCPECGATGHLRRSERADFGGGKSNGVEEL